MCGLVGIVAKTPQGFWNTEADIFREMLYCDVVRGKDATGVFGVNKYGNLSYAKQSSPAGWFISSAEYKEFERTITPSLHVAIGHNRKATHGEKRDADAHPFIKDTICLVHNGMIRNHKDFCKESTVDSNAIANAFASGDFKDILKEVNGAFAFIWYDLKTRQLHFIRNKERPLCIVETDRAWIIASEGMMAHWIAARNNQQVKSAAVIPDSVLHTINLDTKETKQIVTTPLKLYTPPIYPVACTSGGSTIPTPKKRTDTVEKNDVEATLFIDPETLNRPIHEWLSKEDLVSLEILEYSDFESKSFRGTHVTLTCKFLNCNLEGPTFFVTVTVAEVREYLKTCVLTARVKHINYTRANKIQIYANVIGPEDIIETKNGMFITHTQWLADDFVNHCDSCFKLVQWSALEEANVTYKYKNNDWVDINIECATCITKKDTTNAPSTNSLQDVERKLQEVATRAEETAAKLASVTSIQRQTPANGTYD